MVQDSEFVRWSSAFHHVFLCLQSVMVLSLNVLLSTCS